MADEKKVKVIDFEAAMQSNYRGAWTTLKLAIKALELKKQEVVRLQDLKRTLKLLEEKYIKGGDFDEDTSSG